MTETETRALLGSATYSPEDNKLRFYPDARLSPENYQRARSAGFIWAPRQGLFVAPAWTPDREDLLIEWCGEIGDEDKSLVERAGERSDRFRDYSHRRADDANDAHAAVERICEGIPLGQPILVGHHSERRARKDAEKIENGMRRAVKMWEQSKYWQYRAASALRHAKYLELPDVRARRIKKLEAEKRGQERHAAGYQHAIHFWAGKCTLTRSSTGEKIPIIINEENRELIHRALGMDRSANCARFTGIDGTLDYCAWNCTEAGVERYQNCPTPTIEEIRARCTHNAERWLAHTRRWLAHYDNRIAYERAMLGDQGGIVADKFNIGVGGQVLRRGKWHIVTKLNGGTCGKPQSVSVLGHWASTIPAEEIEDYREPNAGDFEKVKAVTAKPPLCNYPGGVVMLQNRYHPSEPERARFATMTQEEWDKVPKDYKTTTQIVFASEKAARHRVRVCLGVYCSKLPPPEGKELEPNYCSANRSHRYWPVFITDAKRKDPPPAEGSPAPSLPQLEVSVRPAYRPTKPEEPTKFDVLRESLKSGVQTVSAPQLFPTPPDLAKRMVSLAEIEPGVCVLEPSAGTGNLVQAVRDSVDTEVVGVEINRELCRGLQRRFHSFELNVRCTDFLTCNGDLGKFDRIVMNPPFDHGSDIKHIKHALKFLNPGGKLVALCAAGPRQEAELQPLADSWEVIPDAFKEQGTVVRVALITISR